MDILTLNFVSFTVLDLLFDQPDNYDNDKPSDDDDQEKGIFEGGTELTWKDMCILDILDGDD